MELTLTAAQAAWLLPGAAVVSLWVAWSDLARMKIPNLAVLALLVLFLVLAPLALPWPDPLWRLTHLVVVLLAGMALNAIGVMGAGDAKFLAAAAPFVALADVPFVLALWAAALILAFVLHRIARASPLRRLVPDWASWTTGKRFPMGVALGMTLVAYLAAPFWLPVAGLSG